MDQGIMSRPRYARLRPDPAGRRHLILSDQDRLPAEAFEAVPEPHELWVVGDDDAAPEGAARRFPSRAALLAALTERLAGEHAGLRLYAAGTEAFIWDADRAARAAGMGRDEVFLCQAGSLCRRVYCTHCTRLTEDVTTSVFRCPGCGRHLFVRDHFSRRLGAFMGVMADAEVPGEVPPAEEIYR